MSPASTTPTRSDARRNRERVLDAAREVLSAEGIDAQMETIARRAGVGVGTLYRNFPTKAALIEALWNDKRERVLALAHETLQRDDPWQGLEELLVRGTDMQADDLAWCDAFNSEEGCRMRGTPPPGLSAALEEHLRRCRDAGVLRPDVGAADIENIFCATGAVISVRGPDARHSLLRLLLGGLRAT